ncbi:MAG TPA: transketolase C-terminal domain-containing protein [Candidatus Omnitrophota bacterium]|nr:transketolase C-terminal domain-containing protein [Candidatus Omnitrophota bacterium]
MNNCEMMTMRDIFIEGITRLMEKDDKIFFLSADFGSPKLDNLRSRFKNRFINVGIAEQNLINLATGLALEGFTVYAYAIAAFLTMRAYEQIRINLSLLAQLKNINVNLIGVGAGLSYDMSGPSHHCLEDISIMRTLPNIEVISPSDWVLAKKFVDYSLKYKGPKYLRFDGKPVRRLYNDKDKIRLEEGFFELRKGDDICLLSTGFMTHTAKRVAEKLSLEKKNIGLVDIFLLKGFNRVLLASLLKRYKFVITLEEGFIGKGGLDCLASGLFSKDASAPKIKSLGFLDAHVFNIGSREYLHSLNKLDENSIIKTVKSLLRK